MAFPYYDLVVMAHTDLIAEGLISRRATQEAVEQDKGLLTRRAGWYVYDQDPTIGLLEKTEGNNSLGYSVDLLIQKKTGVFWDVATDDAGLATPVNGGPLGPDPELAQKWAAPTAALAQVDETSGDQGGVGQPFDDQKAVAFGLACNDAYAESGAAPDAGMIAVHAQRCAFDYYVNDMPWADCLAKHTNAFRAEYGLPPV